MKSLPTRRIAQMEAHTAIKSSLVKKLNAFKSFYRHNSLEFRNRHTRWKLIFNWLPCDNYSSDFNLKKIMEHTLKIVEYVT